MTTTMGRVSAGFILFMVGVITLYFFFAPLFFAPPFFAPVFFPSFEAMFISYQIHSRLDELLIDCLDAAGQRLVEPLEGQIENAVEAVSKEDTG